MHFHRNFIICNHLENKNSLIFSPTTMLDENDFFHVKFLKKHKTFLTFLVQSKQNTIKLAYNFSECQRNTSIRYVPLLLTLTVYLQTGQHFFL